MGRQINPLLIALTSLASIMLTFGIYHHLYFEQLKLNYTQLNFPIETISMNAWWKKNDTLPAYKVSLFGFPSQSINVVWAGDIGKIEQTLFKEGWTNPPARDLVSTLHRIADIQSTEYLSMVSPQYLDKRPKLILTKRGPKGFKGLLVLRLWDSNRIISDTQSPLYVGTVAIIPRSYSWLYKSHPGEIPIDSTYIFPGSTGMGKWEWKIMNQPIGTRRIIYQKIMLIRENKNIHKKN